MVLPSEIRKWPHLKDRRLPQVDKSGVTILIGQDVPEALWPLGLLKGERRTTLRHTDMLGLDT